MRHHPPLLAAVPSPVVARPDAVLVSILLAAVLLAAGCARGPEGNVTVETLPSGVIQTTYTALPLRTLELDTVAVWDVWSGASGYLFSRLTTAAGSDNGFYVLDSGNRQVVETDLAGRMRTVFGGRGEGPGEFGFPRFLNVVGDEVWVGDIMPIRFSVFGRDGDFRRTITHQARLAPDANRCAVMPDGRVLNALDALGGLLSLLCWDLEAGTVDTLATLQSMPEIIVELHRPDGSVVPFDTRPTYAVELHWSYAPSGRLVTVTGGEYAFEERDLAGRLVRRTVAPTPDLTVTEREREAFFAHAVFASGDGTTLSNEEIRRRWQFAERRQAIGSIRLDPLGHVWVLARTADIERNRVDLFDPDHRYLGSFPAPMLPMAFAADGTAFMQAPEGPNGEGLYFSARLR